MSISRLWDGVLHSTLKALRTIWRAFSCLALSTLLLLFIYDRQILIVLATGDVLVEVTACFTFTSHLLTLLGHVGAGRVLCTFCTVLHLLAWRGLVQQTKC